MPSALPNPVVIATLTLSNDITVTRIQAQPLVAPVGCKTNLALQLSDGTTAGTANLFVAAAANDSGVLSLNYAALTQLKVTVIPPAGCTTLPLSINVVVQYKGR